MVGADPYSLQVSFTVTRNIVKGEPYFFRYRAINAIGPGQWSELGQITAATVPVAPAKPAYISSTDTTITLSLEHSTDNGGGKIEEHLLYRDGGDLTTAVEIEVTDYNGVDTQYTVTGLTPGVKYRFNYAAANFLGESQRSLTLTASSSSLPDPPKDIVIDWD